MHINDFRLFLDVAEMGSFSKVAAHRQTVQSHISRQISQLERACGGALFRRTGRGVVLTEFGQYVEQRVRQWIQQSDELFGDIKQLAKIPIGEVKLGILPSAAHPLMTQVFKRLKESYPQVRLNIREGQGSELDALLDLGSVDLAILFRYEKPRNTDEVLLATAGTYLITNPQSALGWQDTVDFKQLADLPLVLPRKGSHWRSILDETARSKGFQFRVEVEADSLTVQKEVVATHPHVFALLGPFSVNEELGSGRLRAVKVVNPDLKRYVTLARTKQGYNTQASKIVAELIQESVIAWNHQLTPCGISSVHPKPS